MLTIKEQIEIYKESRIRYKMYFDTMHCGGMCWAINITLKDKGYDSDMYCIDDFLPTFTNENVRALSVKDRFETPRNPIALDYWWEVPNSKVRLSAFDSFIKQLENEPK